MPFIIYKKNLSNDFFLFNVIHIKEDKKNWEINFTARG